MIDCTRKNIISIRHIWWVVSSRPWCFCFSPIVKSAFAWWPICCSWILNRWKRIVTVFVYFNSLTIVSWWRIVLFYCQINWIINIMRSPLEVKHRTRMANRHQFRRICTGSWHTIKMVKFMHWVFWIFDFLAHRIESSLCSNICSSRFANVKIRDHGVHSRIRRCLSFRNWCLKSLTDAKSWWPFTKGWR